MDLQCIRATRPQLLDIVIPADAGIHFDFGVTSPRNCMSHGKIKMDPSVRWDDDTVAMRVCHR